MDFLGIVHHNYRLLVGYSEPEQFEWNFRTYASVILVALCASLANSAGVGGGPFYMPLFHSVLKFNLVKSTALSHTVVTSSAIASTLYGLWESSPEVPSMPLVDLRLALALLPSLLFGVGIGVLISPTLPHWIQLLGLLILLIFVVHKTYARARRSWKKESERRRVAHTAAAEGLLPVSFVNPDESGQHQVTFDVPETCEGVDFLSVAGCEISQFFNRHWKWMQHYLNESGNQLLSHIHHVAMPFLYTLVLWSLFMALQWGLSQASRCSSSFFQLWGLQLFVCIAAAVSTIQGQLRMHPATCRPTSLSPNLARLFSSGSSISRFLKISVIIACAGAMAGMVGIGGALIFNPYLLSLGLHPQILASTSVFMILFSSSAISISFFFHGFLNTSYAAVFAPVAFLGSLVGVFVVGRIVRNTGRSSIVIFILAILIGLGGVLVAIIEGPTAFVNLIHGQDMKIRPFCPA